MKTSGKGGLTIRGLKTTKKKKVTLSHNGGLDPLSPRRKSRVRVGTHTESYLYK